MSETSSTIYDLYQEYKCTKSTQIISPPWVNKKAACIKWCHTALGIPLFFARNPQPATSNQQPATSNQQPATSNQQPATSNQQPARTFLLSSLINAAHCHQTFFTHSLPSNLSYSFTAITPFSFIHCHQTFFTHSLPSNLFHSFTAIKPFSLIHCHQTFPTHRSDFSRKILPSVIPSPSQQNRFFAPNFMSSKLQTLHIFPIPLSTDLSPPNPNSRAVL